MENDAQRWTTRLATLLDEAPDAEEPALETEAALVDLIAATERAKARVAAVQARAERAFWTAQIRTQEQQGVARDQRGRGIADQVALARRITPKQASDEVALHRVLLDSLPRTSALLDAGEISELAARRVAENVLVLDDEDRASVDAAVADSLPTVTARRAGDLARARAQELDPEAAVKRHQRAVADRRVTLQPAVDGMSILRAVLPLQEGVAVFSSLTDAAKSARSSGDQRTKGQIMADTMVKRVTGLEKPEDLSVEIQLLMTDTTLLGDEVQTAWIDGHPLPGPVARDLALGTLTASAGMPQRHGSSAPERSPLASTAELPRKDSAPEHARRVGTPDEPPPQITPPEVTQAARWIRRLYTDPRTGELQEADPRRRLFRGATRRFILQRDQRCRTPWCDAAIHDVDHVHRFADGGNTDAANGVGLCQRFNLAKEMPGWHTDLEPASDGAPSRLTIRTPTGHVYTSTSPALRTMADALGAEILEETPAEAPDGAEIDCQIDHEIDRRPADEPDPATAEPSDAAIDGRDLRGDRVDQGREPPPAAA
ncbi:HNH endonuclease [Brachybacterium sp. J153]|uniref:HNH endonuclease n=1 Tax=Brachybacterium sp. J153 TaxID=3116488 RepID=UPI002E77734C|nr:DUF222 domain-containing protein [Brachybacterium sp. J153]MEE1619043.1 DUF222 domain-containing protein [Brachybacterium sp. J153]